MAGWPSQAAAPLGRSRGSTSRSAIVTLVEADQNKPSRTGSRTAHAPPTYASAFDWNAQLLAVLARFSDSIQLKRSSAASGWSANQLIAFATSATNGSRSASHVVQKPLSST